MQTQPGLLSQLKTPDTSGMSMGDKIALAGMMMRDNADPSTVMEYQRSRLAQAQFQRQLALQQRGNQAFRAAYQTDPNTGQTRFNPQIYAQVMGDALDPKDMVAMAKTFAPEETLQDGFITQKDPLTGHLTITAKRPMNYGEQNAADTLAETKRYHGVEATQKDQELAEAARSHRANESIAGGNLGVAQAHLGLDAAGQAFEHQKFGASQNPGVPVVTNPGDYARLPRGTAYVAPDGSLRHKQ